MNHDTDSHPSEARLVAYLDGELGHDDRAAVSRHLLDCAECARTMAELRRSSEAFSEVVGGLRPPPTRTTAEDVRRRAAEEAPSAAGDGRGRFAWSRWSTTARIAASVVVLLGAAAALPGSPVRSWLGRSVEQVQALLGGDRDRPAAEELETPPEEAPVVEDRSGVAVSASSGSILITLHGVPQSTAIRVRMVDGPQAGVWNAGGEYRTAPGRIDVTDPESDALLVEIPRTVGQVRLEVNDELTAVSRDGELEVLVPGAELRDGEYSFRPPGTN